MEYTPIAGVTAVPRPAADRAGAYGLQPLVVDGNDVTAMYDVARRSLARARAGDGPALIESLTYRHGGHSRADPGKYRPAEEVRAWRERDPVETYRRHLVSSGVEESALKEIEENVLREVDEATEAAKAAPAADLGVIERDVWADGSSSWRN